MGQLQRSTGLKVASYVLPPGLGLAMAARWLGYAPGWEVYGASLPSLAVASGVVLARVLGGAFAGRAAHAAERQAAREEMEQMLGDLAHDLRGPLTVIRGEVELVLGKEGTDSEERERSGARPGDPSSADEIPRRRVAPRGRTAC